MVAQEGPALEPGYKLVKERAAIGHNAALRDHIGRPMSTGEGIAIYCLCDQAFSFEGYREHIYAICRDTPVAA